MIKLLTIITTILIFVGIVYGVAVGVNIASASNPENKYPIVWGNSIVADNQYHQNGNYDINYDGDTCFRWVTESMPVVVASPRIITFTPYIDDIDITHIISCEQ